MGNGIISCHLSTPDPGKSTAKQEPVIRVVQPCFSFSELPPEPDLKGLMSISLPRVCASHEVLLLEQDRKSGVCNPCK
jgi:hypothetical protein